MTAERRSRRPSPGTRSCKHVFVVDKDIDIYNPLEVEWAMATRFQGDRDLVVLPSEPRLQPGPQRRSRHAPDHQDGLRPDQTAGNQREDIRESAFPEVDLDRFFGHGFTG